MSNMVDREYEVDPVWLAKETVATARRNRDRASLDLRVAEVELELAKARLCLLEAQGRESR